MKTLLEDIRNRNGVSVQEAINTALRQKTLEAISEVRKQVAAETFGEAEDLEEADQLQEQIDEAYLMEWPKAKPVDDDMADKLYKHAVKSHETAVKNKWPGGGNLQPWVDNYKKKQKKGVYDQDKAVQGLTHAIRGVEDDFFGIKRGYDGKKHGNKPTIGDATRRAAAAKLLTHVDNLIQGKPHDAHLKKSK